MTVTYLPSGLVVGNLRRDCFVLYSTGQQRTVGETTKLILAEWRRLTAAENATTP